MKETEEEKNVIAVIGFGVSAAGDTLLRLMGDKAAREIVLDATGLAETAVDIYEGELEQEALARQAIPLERLDALRARFEASFAYLEAIDAEGKAAFAEDPAKGHNGVLEVLVGGASENARAIMGQGRAQGLDLQEVLNRTAAAGTHAIAKGPNGYIGRMVGVTKMFMILYKVRDEYAR